MTKQEEIREGIRDIISKYHSQVPFADEVPEILNYLHSQGVVIKVESELPRNFILGLSHPNGDNWVGEFCVVEPLIKKDV